jgi:hypothetical protein
MLLELEMKLDILDAVAPRTSDVASGLWQLAQLVA